MRFSAHVMCESCIVHQQPALHEKLEKSSDCKILIISYGIDTIMRRRIPLAHVNMIIPIFIYVVVCLYNPPNHIPYRFHFDRS